MARRNVLMFYNSDSDKYRNKKWQHLKKSKIYDDFMYKTFMTISIL